MMWLFNRLKFDFKTIAYFHKNNKHAFCCDVPFVGPVLPLSRSDRR